RLEGRAGDRDPLHGFLLVRRPVSRKRHAKEAAVPGHPPDHPSEYSMPTVGLGPAPIAHQLRSPSAALALPGGPGVMTEFETFEVLPSEGAQDDDEMRHRVTRHRSRAVTGSRQVWRASGQTGMRLLSNQGIAPRWGASAIVGMGYLLDTILTRDT
ncbi:MAG: hypothetical protein ACT4PW_13955, partial [Acidimicrobiia bacterium]